jgi:hypothetical protein
MLWPPNHKYVQVKAKVSATDTVDPNPEIELVSVTSSEPDDAKGNGDGKTINDIQILDDTTFRLRAEREGSGSGRIYRITYKATDSAGNDTTASAVVTVPKSRKQGSR